MNLPNNRKLWTGVAFAAVTVALGSAYAQQGPRGKSSYAPVEITEPFSAILARLSAQKPSVEREHMAVLNERYDLSNRPAAGVTMDRGGNPSISWNSATRAAPDKKRVEHLECARVDAHRPYDFACGGYVCEVVHTSSRAGAVRSRPVFSLVKALNGS